MNGGSEKYMPKVGEHLYLQPKPSNSYYASIVKHPYTVISVSPSEIIVQEAHCVFPTPRYYDTMPTDIVENPRGNIRRLHWAPKVGMWQYNDKIWPEYAHFGEWDYMPYLD